MVLDDLVAIDAGSLAMASTEDQKASIRDIVVSHAHLDHIAGLPLFIDDLFASLSQPVRIHASRDVIDVLETHIFNWSVYPRFSELTNENGPVMEYVPFEAGREFSVKHLSIIPIEVNHKVPSCGFIINDGGITIASTGDTAPTDLFWEQVHGLRSLDAVLIECAFPDELSELADISYHLTPAGLSSELKKLDRTDCAIYVVNIKPAYRCEIVSQVSRLSIDRLEIMDVGRQYEWKG